MPLPEVVIRPLRAGDAEAFLELKRQGLRSDPASFVAALDDDGPDPVERVRERLARASSSTGDVVLGAFVPHLAGVVALTRDPRRKRAHKTDLHGMYVASEHRGQGLGRRLLARALALARDLPGVEEVQLVVATHNREAVALYESHGFVHVWTERRALKLADRYVDAHHMVLDLGPPPAGTGGRAAG